MIFSTEEKREFMKNMILKHNKCNACLLLKSFCICSTLTLLREKYKTSLKYFSDSTHQFRIFTDLNQKRLRSLRVYVLIHYKGRLTYCFLKFLYHSCFIRMI
jgi:DTW domain-containing protein YfiP